MPWLALGYPVLAHIGVWFHQAWLQWLAAGCLLLASVWPLLQRRPIAGSVLLLGSSAALIWVGLRGGIITVLYLPPVAIPLALLLVFAGSLRAGHTPLITRIAEQMRGAPLPDVLCTYTRRVTQVWCGVLVALSMSALVAARWASPEVWSLLVNVLHYVLMGAVFVIEFIYRRIRYRALEPWSMVQYLRRLTTVRIRP
jgi:uncharacterized membrane protein